MKLSEYLAEKGLTVAQFAERADLSAEGVRLILLGKRQARRSTAERIRRASDDEVTLTDLVSEAAE